MDFVCIIYKIKIVHGTNTIHNLDERSSLMLTTDRHILLMRRILGSPCWHLVHSDQRFWPSGIAPLEQRAARSVTSSAREYECRLAFPLH